MKEEDSAGGVVECRISGVPAGIGDPVFRKARCSFCPGTDVYWRRKSSGNR